MLVLSPSASCSGAFYSLCCRGSSRRWEGGLPAAPRGFGKLRSPGAHLSGADSASLPRSSPRFSLPRVPDGLIFPPRQPCHLRAWQFHAHSSAQLTCQGFK